MGSLQLFAENLNAVKVKIVAHYKLKDAGMLCAAEGTSRVIVFCFFCAFIM